MKIALRFYAPWCGHCKNLKPAYEKAATSLDGLAQVAAIDCDDAGNKALCGSMGVKGFPTLKIVKPSSTKPGGKPIVEEYQGARTATGIVEAVKQAIPNNVKRITDTTLDAWLAQSNQTAKALLFSDKGTTSALIKVLALDLLGKMQFGQIRDKDTAAVKTFGITSFPTLIVLPGGEASALMYEGNMAKDPMIDFLSQYASPTAQSSDDSSSSSFTDKKPNDSKEPQKPLVDDEAASSAAAGATSITLEEDNTPPTESPNPIVDSPPPVPMPDVVPPIPTISSASDLQESCLGAKTSTCLLALLPDNTPSDDQTTTVLASLAAIAHKHRTRGAKIFPFYAIPASNPAAHRLLSALALRPASPLASSPSASAASADDAASSTPSQHHLLAVNGRRNWWRHFDPNLEGGYGVVEVEGWIDAIRLGEGRKDTLPPEVLIPLADEPEEKAPDVNVGSSSDTDTAAQPKPVTEEFPVIVEDLPPVEFKNKPAEGNEEQKKEEDGQKVSAPETPAAPDTEPEAASPLPAETIAEDKEKEKEHEQASSSTTESETEAETVLETPILSSIIHGEL